MDYVRQAKLPGTWVPPAGTSTARGLQDPREVVVEMLPRPDNILVDAYAQLLATIEGLKGVVSV